MDEQENLAQLNDRLQAKNHALAQALTRASEELCLLYTSDAADDNVRV